jgi:iron-sulfur cluster repair protein YtfE (RIC family)
MTTTTIDARPSADCTVNDMLLRNPRSGRVFNAFGVDTCCGGTVTLAQAAIDADVALEVLLDALELVAEGVR